ncbi:MAG: DUF3244 domain-containing protein [Bacteroidales bacterium]|jgi:hypothetical protein|nr:DUF3244 domain-containing protein [Bacteroidales bacterium]
MKFIKLTSGILAAGIIVTATTMNLRLNTQKSTNPLLSSGIEALTFEYSEEEDEIDMHGTLSLVPFRSSSQPFQATKYASYIRVNYLANLTNITVQVVKASGQTVYSNTVNTVTGGQLYISLSGLSSGDYTLVFTAPNGNSVYGDFEI